MGGRVLSRRQSRRKAFELLFELEQHPAEQPATIIERTFANPDVQELYATDEDADGYVAGQHDEVSQRYITELVLAVTEHEEALDTELAKYPHEWSFDRIGVPERILLRLAVAEMVYLGTSYKVVINEALDLAKLYAQDEARKFINGILGSVVNNLDQLKQANTQEGTGS
ncbi:MAG TPA: transcription antitermination factor NusB [Firmicutes bacterium]|nr:transcription antitermination factor NusB [Bacillota bacterium]